jgi:hypothetical protein
MNSTGATPFFVVDEGKEEDPAHEDYGAGLGSLPMVTLVGINEEGLEEEGHARQEGEQAQVYPDEIAHARRQTQGLALRRDGVEILGPALLEKQVASRVQERNLGAPDADGVEPWGKLEGEISGRM